MPQEIREPQFRTARAIVSVERTLRIYGIISNTPLNIQDTVFNRLTEDLNGLEFEQAIVGIIQLEKVFKEDEPRPQN